MKTKIAFSILFFLNACIIIVQGQELVTREIDKYGRVSYKKNFSDLENDFNTKSLTWTTAIKISDYVNEDSRDMDIAMSSDSTLHIVYCDDVPGFPVGAEQRIIYKSKPLGGNWSTDLVIDEFSGVSPRNNHESSIYISDNDDIHIVFHYWAYDGTFKDQIGYTKYDKLNNLWSTEIISGNTGTVESFYNYPEITGTELNIPVAVWGYDNRNGNDEVYLTFNKGTGWQTPILISSVDSNTARYPRVVSIGNNKVFVAFQEYNNNGDSIAIYYRIFDVSLETMSEIMPINNQRQYSYNYNFDATRKDNDNVFISYNIQDTLYACTYNIINNTLSQSPYFLRTNINSYINYNLVSASSDDNGAIHIAYTIWNTLSNSVKYVKYTDTDGFGTPQIISTKYNSDKPVIRFGKDQKLHVVFCDNSEDTNNDGYLDREVYYLSSDITTAYQEISFERPSIKIFPNPVDDYLSIEGSSINNIEICDITGRVISSTKSDSLSKIDLSWLSSGIYLIKVYGNDYVVSEKIIKK